MEFQNQHIVQASERSTTGIAFQTGMSGGDSCTSPETILLRSSAENFFVKTKHPERFQSEIVPKMKRLLHVTYLLK